MPTVGGHEHLMSLDVERLLQRRSQPFGHPDRVARVGDVLEQDGELVAAEARQREPVPSRVDGIGGAQARLQPTGDGDQQAIRGQRPQAVVHDLEAVEAEDEQRKRVVAAPLACA